MEEAVSKAERIRASRGKREAEVSCTEERGLHQCLIMCDKNPGHHNFIPANDFNIEHLPSCFRDSDIVDYVRATSDITCRVSVTGISEDRPDTWPDSDEAFPFSAYKGESAMMVGTGRATVEIQDPEKGIYNRRMGLCICEECSGPGTPPARTWARVRICTALHVVYDDEEARSTKCQFFYDSHETDINTVLTLTGFTVVERDIEGDNCWIEHYTHNVEALDKLDKACKLFVDLRTKVYDKRAPTKNQGECVPAEKCDTDVKRNLCVVVSHPHGCAKVVSIGTWTHRHVRHTLNTGLEENVTYSYNTPTCPGSSGAPVITLWEGFLRWLSPNGRPPAHSEGGPGNDNRSGGGWERICDALLKYPNQQDGV